MRKRISLLLSRFKAMFREQTTAIFTRWKRSKIIRPNRDAAQRRSPKRAPSFLTNLKSSIGVQMATIANRLKKLLPSRSTKEAPRWLTMTTPVQLREPVGAPILQKYKVANKSNIESAAKLQNARKEDSKHPGNLGRELLRKVRPTIEKSSRAMVQLARQRFLATKALLKQETIEESIL